VEKLRCRPLSRDDAPISAFLSPILGLVCLGRLSLPARHTHASGHANRSSWSLPGSHTRARLPRRREIGVFRRASHRVSAAYANSGPVNCPPSHTLSSGCSPLSDLRAQVQITLKLLRYPRNCDPYRPAAGRTSHINHRRIFGHRGGVHGGHGRVSRPARQTVMRRFPHGWAGARVAEQCSYTAGCLRRTPRSRAHPPARLRCVTLPRSI